ncbi:MAG TPA: hypothetical protein VKV35_00885 [Streptosporangiaceae bacterium]|nr:hypothetical protein [Streptosporangiaceae bacterium]
MARRAGTRYGGGKPLAASAGGQAGKAGTGFDTKTLRSLHGRLARLERESPASGKGRLPPPRAVHWVEPRLVAQIGFAEWTRDGELRRARSEGLRDGKEAEVVREVPS